MRLPFAFITTLLLALPMSSAHAGKTYCCTDANGRQACGDSLPRECFGRAYKELSDRGTLLRQVDAPLTAEQQAQHEAAQAQKKKEERAAMEEKRKNQALLNTYTSEKDVDIARDRALADLEARAKEAQVKLTDATKRKQKLEGEMEFYKKKPVPAELKDQIKGSETEIKVQQAAIDAKKQEMDQVRVKFEEEKKRYLELMRGGKAAAASGK
ncbi:MAG: hypothetical protein HY847_14180 [Betaproteobacteria bacterium]|nr:hypothetical protein [Betaproteobacteria bacterium]